MNFEIPAHFRASRKHIKAELDPPNRQKRISFELKILNPKPVKMAAKPIETTTPGPVFTQFPPIAEAQKERDDFWFGFWRNSKTWLQTVVSWLQQLHIKGFSYEPDFSSNRQKASYWISLSLMGILFIVSNVFIGMHFSNQWYLLASPKVRVLDLVLVTLSFTSIHLFHLIWYPPSKQRPTDSQWFRWGSFVVFLLGWAAFLTLSILVIYLLDKEETRRILDANKVFTVASSILLRLAVTVSLFPATSPPGGRKCVRNGLLFYLSILAVFGITIIVVLLIKWEPTDPSTKLGLISILLGLEVEVMSLIDRLRQTQINSNSDLENQMENARKQGCHQPQSAVFADISPAGGIQSTAIGII